MDESHRKAANAVGGSTARACEGCLRRRARWYCGADDAFLCQSCDSSVHSANSLARRHQRLRLHSTSFSSPSSSPPPISWRKRKARTPRAHPPPRLLKPEPLVPDLDRDEEDELDMELMCCVPELDPLFDDLCFEFNPLLVHGPDAGPGPSVDDLEVALDNLNDSLCVDGFSFVDEEFEAMGDAMGLCEKGEVGEEGKERELGERTVKIMGLRLDYDAVIDAWSRSGGSPWAGGDRPQFDSDGCLPVITGTSEGVAGWSRGKWGASGGEEREARVTRYREKRRTRLFSKKIRYEVRKLNAEKRPRMKGRFVKRTALSAGPGQGPYQF